MIHESTPHMLKLATLIENPGEPLIDSRYHNPHELKDLGYNGVVVYHTTALSGIPNPDVIIDPEYKRWVNSHFQRVDQEIKSAVDAGLSVYLFYDMLVLPTDLVDMDRNSICCKNRTDTICPSSKKAYELSIQALSAHLTRWPEVCGIVLRFGDSDATRLPFLSGNDIYAPYCPKCSGINKLDRILYAIKHSYNTVVSTFNKQLIVRAWNVRPNGLHDSTDLASRLAEKLPSVAKPNDQFMISFKSTQTDFWRYQSWNQASLEFNDYSIIYEFQCQREFEGKGTVANWQLPLWQHGMPETKNTKGLATVAKQIEFSGSLAWVRGGGWGGPFVKNESWIDLNVFSAPKLTDNPKLDQGQLIHEWITERLDIHDPKLTDLLSRITTQSHAICRDLFYIKPLAEQHIDAWYPNEHWLQDDVIDVDALSRIIQKLPQEVQADLIEEKRHASQTIAKLRTQLQQHLNTENHTTLDPLITSFLYIESLAETIYHLSAALSLYHHRYKNKVTSDKSQISQHILAAQNHWNHHTQRIPTLPGSPTTYREKNFWELTQTILNEIQST
ncbi:hypothetical protein KS4_17980 [Poriferisphaera corsica]|uniref:Uncharacterized protein n=1 Tax=Poriferisphaera corsica TaxID=2528020 RepID=A0A517YU98_9BACT|nr:hypothetical protein [Poriferisphaera corsica]QDU33742.1 hypothetical protein KS4_17980 [Poriferisphaera corsica]